jgi:hypothetical protein
MSNPFPRGCKVRCQRDKPTNTGWAQFDGKVGTVRVPDNLGEVGVIFGELTNHGSPTIWFLPSALVRVTA